MNMPELPEVETIRKALNVHLKGRRISGIDIIDPTLLTGHGRNNGSSFENAERQLHRMIGCTIKGIDRLGKSLIFKLSSKDFLLMSLRMTGRLVLSRPLPSARGRFSFKGEPRVLNFIDRRRLGELHPMSSETLNDLRKRTGPDALQHWEVPRESARKESRAKIHATLLDQGFIAGVGNIYATEALFRAGIKPQRTFKSLTRDDFRRLGRDLGRVLEAGIRHRGCTFDSYRDLFNRSGRAQKYLNIYGKAGQACPVCRRILQFTRISGRGVTYCSRCQH